MDYSLRNLDNGGKEKTMNSIFGKNVTCFLA